MKMTRKLIVGVLSLALLVSGFAFASSAEENGETEDYKAILEYYSQPTFISEDFEGQTVGSYNESFVLNGAGVIDATLQFAEVVEDEDSGNKYLRLNTASLAAATSRTGNFSLGWTSDSYANGVIADFSILGDGSHEVKYTCSGSYTVDGKEKPCGAKIVVAADGQVPAACDKCGGADTLEVSAEGRDPIIHLYLDSVKDDLSAKSVSGTELLTFNFEEKTVSYLTADGTVAVADFELNPSTWYDVTLEYNGIGGSYSLTVTDASDATKALTLTDVSAPATLKTVKTVRLNTLRKGGENLAQQICFDDLSIVGGSFRRDDTQAQTLTEAAVVRYAELCSATPAPSLADRQAMIDVYVALTEEYGFTTTDTAAQTALATLGQYSVTVYTELIEECVDNIDYESGYYARIAHADGYSRYLERIPYDDEEKIGSLVGTDKKQWVLDTVDAYNGEYEALEQLKADSLTFIESVKIVDITINDYAKLVATRDEVKAVTPDPYYDGVADALAILASLESKIDDIKSRGDSFIANVGAIVTGEGFAEKYEAFCAARNGYFDNKTYPGITDALASYETQRVEIEPVESYCKEYILWVDRARFSTYVNAKEENIKTADTFDEEQLEPEFPGMTEARATHDAIKIEIEESKRAAEAYVAAVAALEGLSGTALEEGIANAKELKKTGDIPGIDGVDVTGANIKLTNLEASITLYVAQSRQFVTLVSRIADAETLTERFAAINAARAIAGKATDTHEGVSDAKNKLAAAITAYNSDVSSVNEEYGAVTSTAADLLTSVVKSSDASAISAKVVALIKKIFE